MKGRSRISKWYRLPWLLVLLFLIQGGIFGAAPPPELGDNLVVNGDFEQGNTGFETDYRSTTGSIIPESVESGRWYCVDNKLQGHFSTQTISDIPWVTTGQSGNFMMVNGSGNEGDVVWRETISVNPHINYTFSARLVHMHKQENTSTNTNRQARLQFVINGESLGEQLATKAWTDFTISWNSGDANTATIAIYDLITYPDAGNDFGLDDISLRGELVMGPVSKIAPVCAGSSMTLTPPEFFFDGCSGQWEIFQGDNILYTSVSNTISNIPIGWNGCFLRYAVNYQGGWHYSNVVQLYITSGLNVDIQVVEGNATICEGDTVHLHAHVTGDVMDFDFIRVGDILCTDGSIVHPSDWASSGKTAKGIVFYVDETDVHGWALGLSQNRVKWSNNTGSISGMPNIPVARNAIRDFNGEANTGHINTEQYPAAWYCIENGGYLPSIGQLNVLFGGFAIVNASLELVDGVTFPATSGWFLWSSTAQADDMAYCIDRSGKIDTSSKTINGTTNVPKIARPVYDF